MGEDVFLLTLGTLRGAHAPGESGHAGRGPWHRHPRSYGRCWSIRRHRPVAIETLLPALVVIPIATPSWGGNLPQRNSPTWPVANSSIHVRCRPSNRKSCCPWHYIASLPCCDAGEPERMHLGARSFVYFTLEELWESSGASREKESPRTFMEKRPPRYIGDSSAENKSIA